jgi:hypothetical protein
VVRASLSLQAPRPQTSNLKPVRQRILTSSSLAFTAFVPMAITALASNGPRLMGASLAYRGRPASCPRIFHVSLRFITHHLSRLVDQIYQPRGIHLRFSFYKPTVRILPNESTCANITRPSDFYSCRLQPVLTQTQSFPQSLCSYGRSM